MQHIYIKAFSVLQILLCWSNYSYAQDVIQEWEQYWTENYLTNKEVYYNRRGAKESHSKDGKIFIHAHLGTDDVSRYTLKEIWAEHEKNIESKLGDIEHSFGVTENRKCTETFYEAFADGKQYRTYMTKSDLIEGLENLKRLSAGLPLDETIENAFYDRLADRINKIKKQKEEEELKVLQAKKSKAEHVSLKIREKEENNRITIQKSWDAHSLFIAEGTQILKSYETLKPINKQQLIKLLALHYFGIDQGTTIEDLITKYLKPGIQKSKNELQRLKDSGFLPQ